MKVWRKQTVRYVNAEGAKTTKDDPAARRERIESKRFYGTLRTSDGKRKQVPLAEDEESARALLRRLQTEADKDRALGISPEERRRDEPLKTWLERYEVYLRSLARNEHHVTTTVKRARLLLGSSKVTTIAAIDAAKLLQTIHTWRKSGTYNGGRRRKVIPSLETCNHYMRSAKAFTTWLWRERVISDDPLRGLRPLNSDVERAKVRRAMTSDELQALITHTRAAKSYGGKRWRLSGKQRSILYTLAASTGLRASELASLKRSSIDLENGTVTIAARASKNKRADTLPLSSSILSQLSEYLGSLGDSDYLFPGTWAQERQAGVLFKKDAKRAGIVIANDDGESLDFHALRTSYITSLARSGVHPSIAQRLARHSTITLTLDTYTRIGSDDSLREAVERLPRLK